MKTETFKFDFNFQKCAQDEINLFLFLRYSSCSTEVEGKNIFWNTS